MKTALSLALLSLLSTSAAWAANSQLFTAVRTCQGWIHPTGSTPYSLTVEAYVHSSLLGSPPSNTYDDGHTFVTEVHQTTNNFFRRDAQSARVQGSVNSSGVLTTLIRTSSFSGCTDCYTLKIVSSAGGHVFTGTIKFVGDPTAYTLDCSAD
jgi:hypothetical protein